MIFSKCYRVITLVALTGFSRVDTTISRLHPEFEFRENLKRQNLQVYFTLSIALFFILAYLAASQEHIFPSFMYLEFYIMPVTWLIIFQLDYFLINLRKRFVFVNSQLKNFVSFDNTKSNTTATTSLNFSQLNDLNFIHFTLYKISSEINNTYGIRLLIMILRVIFFSVLPLHYNIVSALVDDPKHNGDLTPWSHIFTLSYIILLASPVFYVVNEASGTVNQVRFLMYTPYSDQFKYHFSLALSVQFP